MCNASGGGGTKRAQPLTPPHPPRLSSRAAGYGRHVGGALQWLNPPNPWKAPPPKKT